MRDYGATRRVDSILGGLWMLGNRLSKKDEGPLKELG